MYISSRWFLSPTYERLTEKTARRTEERNRKKNKSHCATAIATRNYLRLVFAPKEGGGEGGGCGSFRHRSIKAPPTTSDERVVKGRFQGRSTDRPSSRSTIKPCGWFDSWWTFLVGVTKIAVDGHYFGYFGTKDGKLPQLNPISHMQNCGVNVHPSDKLVERRGVFRLWSPRSGKEFDDRFLQEPLPP